MSKSSRKNGFAIIEVVVYLALFSIIIGGGMVAVYQIIQSTDAGENQVILQEEANFLLRKINWSLTGADTVDVPSSTSLSVDKPGMPTLLFDLNSSNLRLKTGSDPAVILNSESISVSGLSFSKTVSSGKPDAIATAFTLTTVQNGRNMSQEFTTTKYLRK